MQTVPIPKGTSANKDNDQKLGKANNRILHRAYRNTPRRSKKRRINGNKLIEQSQSVGYSIASHEYSCDR